MIQRLWGECHIHRNTAFCVHISKESSQGTAESWHVRKQTEIIAELYWLKLSKLAWIQRSASQIGHHFSLVPLCYSLNMKCNPPPQTLMCKDTEPQMVELFWEVTETLGGGAKLEEVDWGGGRSYHRYLSVLLFWYAFCHRWRSPSTLGSYTMTFCLSMQVMRPHTKPSKNMSYRMTLWPVQCFWEV